jgi:hypothetical protein
MILLRKETLEVSDIPKKFSLGTLEIKRLFGRARRWWAYNIKLDLKEIVWKATYLIHIILERAGTSDNVTEFSDGINPAEFMSISKTIIFSLRNLKILKSPGSISGRKTLLFHGFLIYFNFYSLSSQSQWPRGLKRSSTTARLFRSLVWIPPGPGYLSVVCVCYVLSDRGICDELITRPEESYWL